MDSAAKKRWECENVLTVTVKVNRNQDPDFYDALRFAESRAGLVRWICGYLLRSSFAKILDSPEYNEYLRTAIYLVDDNFLPGKLFDLGIVFYGDYLYGRDLEELCLENNLNFLSEQDDYTMVGHTFRVRDEFVDTWAVDESFVENPVVSAKEITWLSEDRDIPLNELMEQVIPID